MIKLTVYVYTKVVLNLFLAMLVLAGCQSISLQEPMGTIHTSPGELSTKELNDDVMVFGRLIWVNNGEEQTKYRNEYGWNIWPLYFRVEDKSNGVLGVTESGHFAWRLPKGTYILYHLRWLDDVTGGQRRLPLRLSFKAPEAGKAYCIGTIYINIQSRRDILGTMWIKNWYHLVDNKCMQEREWFKNRYSKLELPFQQSLLLYHSGIPEGIEELESEVQMHEFFQSIYPLLMIYSY